MIDFYRLDLNQKARYDECLMTAELRGCEYSFTNLFLWGRQKAAFVDGRLVIFSQFNRRSVYPFPVGPGDVRPALDAVIHDAKLRGIPCYITSMTEADKDTLASLYPGRFQFFTDRDTFDYLYDINSLADLKGRKYQKKRNHIHRFEEAHPDWQVLPLDASTRVAAFTMAGQWYRSRKEADPHADFHLEELALQRAFAFQAELGLEGLVLTVDRKVVAFTMGSRLNANTFDVHFEKALDIADGAYPTINREFARYLRSKYPELRWLNREDDMGLEGLRKAKLSYAPDLLLEKHWARLWEEEDEHVF
ncbi:MAG: DUF2156 domain-containing protein [Oscillospiraceae bacterium]|nr:DUF2156 domain-containing protein [Oscillospiraceae bacterium]